jgi:hypothetical protein
MNVQNINRLKMFQIKAQQPVLDLGNPIKDIHGFHQTEIVQINSGAVYHINNGRFDEWLN